MKTNIFKPIWDVIYNTVRWFAGIVEDRPDSASSKRVVLFFATYMLYRIVIRTTPVDPNVIIAVVIVILVCLGVITKVNLETLPTSLITKTTKTVTNEATKESTVSTDESNVEVK